MDLRPEKMSRSQPTLKFIHTEFDYCHLWMKAEEKFYGLFIKLPHIKTEKAKLELLIDSTLLFYYFNSWKIC